MGALLMWNGGNSKKARVLMSDFEDKQRGVMRRVKTNRKFDARILPETNSGAISDAKAVVIVSGNVMEGMSPHAFFDGALFGDMPGVVAKIVMQSQERGGCGCAFFFADEQSANEYLSGGPWSRAAADSSWDSTTAEKYGICGTAA